MYRSLALTVLLASSALATVRGPVISANFPDPCIFRVGTTSYAFSTNSGGVNIQIAESPDDGTTWNLLTGQDALPNVGGWATGGSTWAPDVVQRDDGVYVLYYAAESPSAGTHCVGAATSTNIKGPYTPRSQPIGCATSGGGAIDPAGFRDSDGTRYVVYKVDGNNLGGGGSCGNGDGSHSTPIMLQKLNSDAVTPTGNPVQILDRGQYDGPLIEAPALILHSGTYVLFFSSNCYNTDLYDISYATASSVSGPYTKAAAPFKVTGNNGLTAPGGLDPRVDGTFAVFHATTSYSPFTRAMFTATLDWNGIVVSS